MEAVVNRKAEALECIYKRYESLLRPVILSVIRDESEVEDVLHDVLLQSERKGAARAFGHVSTQTLPGPITAKSRLSARDRKPENGHEQSIDVRVSDHDEPG